MIDGTNNLRLEWRAVQKRYGRRVVWRNLAGELTSGDVLAVVGANGSGKSTLIRLFCGLEAPTSGTIEYHWHNAILTPSAMRPQLGVVAPDIALYRELTALEHLRLFATARGLSLNQADLHEQLSLVGLDQRANEQVAVFSSGMLLRLKYAVALLHQPVVLLLDEPTAMFDDAGREFVERIIKHQQQRGMTILATNDERDLTWATMLLRTTSDQM